ncbi:hypothetical protein L596_011692 [Steinernema carpocapsae]|uniref:BPTI/Kunitz inhibitor domain-containing protein n=1 Tax=Steinernema carpocapsae TaxID=34508 RepID=A0A4U5NVH9_STECR|nr:hypothetical protein L596_011692 [Steinernema carpocapsae]
MRQSLLLLAVFVAIVAARRLPEEDEIGGPIPLCSDGKGALLEAGRVFRCSQTCPDGFFCEFRDEAKTPDRGICCPDLEKLYQLYGDSAPDAKVFEIELRRKGIRSGENRTKSSEAPREREEVVVDLTKLDEAEGENGVEEEVVRQKAKMFPEPMPTPAPLRIPSAKLIREDPKAYSCKRARFEPLCKNGTLPTQFTLRWYSKNGKCCSYPYGFCPGSLVVEDNKLRTKAACEEYCLKAEAAKAHDVPTNPEEAQIGTNFEEFASPPPPFSKEPTKEDLENFEKLKRKACERSVPYRDFCEDAKMPSQFTLRWYAKNGKCCSYPYGYCHGETVVSENLIRTKESCEKHCVQNKPVSTEMLRFE